jgi:hypothetical protein
MKSIIQIALLFLFLEGQAQTFFKGRVIDYDKNGIEGVHLILKISRTADISVPYEGTTKTGGYFSIEIRDKDKGNLFEIVAKKAGYDDKETLDTPKNFLILQLTSDNYKIMIARIRNVETTNKDLNGKIIRTSALNSALKENNIQLSKFGDDLLAISKQQEIKTEKLYTQVLAGKLTNESLEKSLDSIKYEHRELQNEFIVFKNNVNKKVDSLNRVVESVLMKIVNFNCERAEKHSIRLKFSLVDRNYNYLVADSQKITQEVAIEIKQLNSVKESDKSKDLFVPMLFDDRNSYHVERIPFPSKDHIVELNMSTVIKDNDFSTKSNYYVFFKNKQYGNILSEPFEINDIKKCIASANFVDKPNTFVLPSVITVKNATITITVHDFDDNDGDVVSFVLNNVPLTNATNVSVSKERKPITIQLNRGENTLEMIAVNQGKNPPCTVDFAVIDDKDVKTEDLEKKGQATKRKLNSNTNRSEAVIIRYEPEN